MFRLPKTTIVECDDCEREMQIRHEHLIYDSNGVDILGVCPVCWRKFWSPRARKKILAQIVSYENTNKDAYEIAQDKGYETGIPGADHEDSSLDWIFED